MNLIIQKEEELKIVDKELKNAFDEFEKLNETIRMFDRVFINGFPRLRYNK